MPFPLPFLRRLGAAGLCLIVATSAAQAQSQDHSVSASHIKGPTTVPTLPFSPYESALKLKQQGDYAKAIELLEPEAKQGHGFELAQLVLGQCYLAVAAKAATPEAATESTRKGAAWIEVAAEAGLTTAQEQMARLYIEGGRFKVEPVEAGKWYEMWKANPLRFQAVNAPFDPKLEQKLKSTLTDAQWDQARQAAMEQAGKAPPE